MGIQRILLSDMVLKEETKTQVNGYIHDYKQRKNIWFFYEDREKHMVKSEEVKCTCVVDRFNFFPRYDILLRL